MRTNKEPRRSPLARRVRFAAALGLLALVGSGCAVTQVADARTGGHELPQERGEAYQQAVEAYAREVKLLVRQAPEEAASGTAEAAAGCALDEEGDYGDALYSPEVALASEIELVSAEDDCNKEDIACNRRCMNNPNPPYEAKPKGSYKHVDYCQRKCHREYMDCMRKAGLLQKFEAMDAALAWLKNHGTAIAIGTGVVIGGVIYVVATGGAGSLVFTLLPAVL